MESQKKRTWAEVSMEKLAHNYHALRQLTPYGTKFMGLVKADAYGHGAVPVAKKLEELGRTIWGSPAWTRRLNFGRRESKRRS